MSKLKPKKNGLRKQQTKDAWLLLTPTLIFLGVMTLAPMIYTIYISLTTYNLKKSPVPTAFVGLKNYIKAFTDAAFWDRMLTTVSYTIISVALTIALGLAIALLLQKPSKTHTILKTLLIFPYAVSSVVKGYLWKFMLQSGGVLDHALDFLLPFLSDYNWLSNRWLATFFLATTEIWGWAPLIALMFLGSLGNISQSIFEAAELDGTTNSQLFWKITLPLLKPIILTTTVMKIIFSLKMFETAVAMTGGGPGDSTQTLNYYIYNTAFKFTNMGYAAALAVITIILVAILVSVYLRLSRKENA